jgi:hypothetical protein
MLSGGVLSGPSFAPGYHPSTVTPFTVSSSTLDWWNQLGPWRDADNASGIAGYGYPLLTFLDAIGSQYAVTEAYTRDDATHIGWGQLLDVNACPTAALPWLAQFVGVTIPIGANDAQMRALIVGQANTKRGTASSMIAAVQQYLTGPARVDIYERTPDPYSLKVVSYLTETPGGAGGANAVAALAALIAVKPAGLLLSYLVQSGPTWEQLYDYPASTLGRWSDQTDTWDSYSNEIPVIA